MKLFLFTLMILMGIKTNTPHIPNYDYDAAWQMVNTSIDNGLPKTALEKVIEIKANAEQEKNDPQYIKAIGYIAKLSINTNEDGIEKAIDILKNVIAEKQAPIKQITASYLAELYNKYFENNRYDISQRSNTVGDSASDFKLWSSQDFIETVTSYYLISIADKSVLQIPTNEYKVILNQFDSVAIHFRPSLYEVLADRAISFFQSNLNTFTGNSESFNLDDAPYFGDISSFSQMSLPSTDTSNPKLQLIGLFQDLLKLELQRKDRSALAEYNAQRLAFVFQNSILSNKEQLYLDGIRQSIIEFEDIAFCADIMATLATKVYEIQSDSTANIQAISICEQAILKYPNTSGANNCNALIQVIKAPSLSIVAEQIYPADQSLIMKLDYNNISKLMIQTIKIDKNIEETLRTGNSTLIQEAFVSAIKLREITQTIPSSPTLQSQSMELSHPALPFGKYAIVISDTNGQRPIIQYVIFQISNLSYTVFESENKHHYLVRDRVSGKPLTGVKLALLTSKYNRNDRKYEIIQEATTYLSDKNGQITLKGTQNTSHNIKLTYGADEFAYGQINGYYNEGQSNETRFAEIFTDRSIFRPGQTIYFKAILLKSDAKHIPSILKKEQVKVELKDANYQVVSSMDLQSNEFGSVHGSFVLPTDRLNGQYSIHLSSLKGVNGDKYFMVEEYKRPSFEVKTDPIVESYVVHDTVRLTGSASTFAGSNVDGAVVKYKIVRTARFPNWWCYWRMPYQSPEFLITEGETTTDEKGHFSIDFKAIPDLSVDTVDLPVFQYRVEIDVTDQRGETRTISTQVSAGYSAYFLNSSLPNRVDVSQIVPIKVTAVNNNGQEMSAKGKVVISKLVEPKQVQIDKYWEESVDHTLTVQEYKKHFSQYKQPKMDNFSKWEVEKIWFDGVFSTADPIAINNNWDAGVYRLHFSSQDPKGNPVLLDQYVVITDFGKKTFPKTSYLFGQLDKNKLEPGEKMSLHLGVPEAPVYAYVIIEKDGKLIYNKAQKISKNSTITLPITEEYRGGMNISVSYHKQNRYYQEQWHVDVPWSNKELAISYETWRDKTLPGSKESFLIKIKGSKKDQVAAEMVASMYDAALDQFVDHEWNKRFYPNSYSQIYLTAPGYTSVSGQYMLYAPDFYYQSKQLVYPSLLDMIDYYGYGRPMQRAMMGKSMAMETSMVMEDSNTYTEEIVDIPRTAEPPAPPAAEIKDAGDKIPQLRTNFKETVFFYPDLHTNEKGEITLSFTINDALTKWRLMTFVHTTDFKIGYDERYIQTQKPLMVFPNPPRFFRDGDQIEFSTKVSNLSDTSIKGTASIALYNALTMEDITTELLGTKNEVVLDIEKGRSQGIFWSIKIPESKFQAITYRVMASSGVHTDAEENTIPVVSNRTLVTETMPMWIGGGETKQFTFEAFKNNVSNTKKDFSYTVEYTNNPIWYAIQALPYLAEEDNPSTLALINRFYANALSEKIVTSHPKIKAVFDQWMYQSKDVLLSNLDKNKELKSALMQETPWVLQAASETEQKKNIALLFDANMLANTRQSSILKLTERQLESGAFPWCIGSREDIYTTQLFLENMGNLSELDIIDLGQYEVSSLVNNAWQFVDDELVNRYTRLEEQIKKYGGNLEDDHLDNLSIQYLYISTFYPSRNPTDKVKKIKSYYYSQAKKYWVKKGIFDQAMIGIVFCANDIELATPILKSLREKSFQSAELGMYWNEGNGFHWYQLPIERHAMLISFFTKAEASTTEVDKMKIWLLKNKQTNHWETSKSTVAALYALLLRGENGQLKDWAIDSKLASIIVGNETWKVNDNEVEAGTGYIKKAYISDQIDKAKANITITNPNSSIAWGAAYYSYLEDLDNIKSFADTPLKLDRKLYKMVRSNQGDQIKEITPGTALKPGDKLTVRIAIKVDRDMEYIHMKDMRASGFEPLNVLSGYKYQGGLGYYESTKDMSTQFYIPYLAKGTYVFEYPIIVVHSGHFSSGITTIQSLYAPEYSSHSNGQRIIVQH